ncbi:M61 family metallopeptidase [Cyclobacterium jeungdonense]|uniref:M61 family metallopeptidase n=1 Tax=Cyclobacterium jeungdonense TaxID=708087 RepID=A0ABT8C8B3_9BACT|nr:M61 family metallopeptidase [Cyclobacterium jeungdonense]MDN3689034.1 M61 family metallopeptidase [Cyclobacterium jeungdonense]
MIYTLSAPIPSSQTVEIQLEVQCKKEELVHLQFPSWRPGRYEIANYAQYLKTLGIQGPKGSVVCRKKTKDLWEFTAPDSGLYRINYTYHAAQLDAGGSWVSPEMIYINFINLAFALIGREEEPITIQLKLPETYQVACALPQAECHSLVAKNFQEMVDSPLLASETLHHRSYQVENSQFHLWVSGNVSFDWEGVLEVFRNFTQKQIDDFGDFPAKAYHFLIHLLPFPHYHGVEHKYSTVITLGPDSLMASKEAMDRLMGICSHELYHFWNVCRIRPKAIQPYDFSKEAYLNEGLIAEGVTTFMGDFYLLKSGYYSPREYLDKMETIFERGFENQGWENQSIIDSSFDLWLDGYKAGVPDKKVSIYTHGALLSLTVDLMLLKHGRRMHEVMKIMWAKFGKTDRGYTVEDFRKAIISLSGNPGKMDSFFECFVFGKDDLYPLLKSLLPDIGLEIQKVKKDNRLESEFGIKTDNKGKIIRLHPKSAAYQQLMIQDEILTYGFTDSGAHLNLKRWQQEKTVFLPLSDQSYFMNFRIRITGLPDLFERFIRL